MVTWDPAKAFCSPIETTARLEVGIVLCGNETSHGKQFTLFISTLTAFLTQVLRAWMALVSFHMITYIFNACEKKLIAE